MTLKQEIYQDIIENCDIFLNLLKSEVLTNDTAAGRMIYQCRWLKEQVAADTLIFPVKDYVHTLKHVYAERSLMHLASSEVHYREEIGIYLYRLLYLIDGKLLLKPVFYPYAIRCMDALLKLLQQPIRPLNQYEQGAIAELTQLKGSLMKGKIEPPLMRYLPDYPNFREVYSMTGSSIDDLPNGKILCKTVANLLFEGVRPDAWITPQDADKDTANL